MAQRASIEVTVEQDALAKLALKLKAEEGGKLLRLELARNLRVAVDGAVQEVKAGARSIHTSKALSGLKEISSKGTEVFSSLGAAVAAGITTEVRMSGRATGVSIKARKKGMPRDFINAPKRLNAKNFRRRVFGRNVWVMQVGAPGFFDRPLHSNTAKYREACRLAMHEMAQRIAR